MAKTGILFVCTGNICRSPTAEGVFLDRVGKAGMANRVFADSAGTQGYHAGDPPDPRAIRIAAGYGIDIGDLRARQIQNSDFDAYDLIVALDRGHLAALERMAGELSHKPEHFHRHPGERRDPGEREQTSELGANGSGSRIGAASPLVRDDDKIANKRKPRFALLLSFAPDIGLDDVPDPYYKGDETFHEAFGLIEKGVEGLVQHLGESYLS